MGPESTFWKSSDPFEPLAPALRYLKLFHLPLYPSFLHLRALTELAIHYEYFSLHLDTLLDFLEENRSPESLTLGIRFTEDYLPNTRRGAPIVNQLRHLSIAAARGEESKVLISNIALRRGAHLEVSSVHTLELSEVRPTFPRHTF